MITFSNTRKYYRVIYTPKSHSDYPSPTFEDIFSTDGTQEDYEKKLHRYTHGCEDWHVRETSKEAYDEQFRHDDILVI